MSSPTANVTATATATAVPVEDTATMSMAPPAMLRTIEMGECMYVMSHSHVGLCLTVPLCGVCCVRVHSQWEAYS
jgi:hypothetical protein